MKQKLTSRFPLLVRAAFLALSAFPFWIAVLLFIPRPILLEWRWAALGVAIGQVLYLGIYLCFLKEVWVDENYIYIATLLKKAQAPLETIDTITTNKYGRATKVKILFAEANDIGAKLTFMPYVAWQDFGNHPVVIELKRLVMNRKQQIEKYRLGQF